MALAENNTVNDKTFQGRSKLVITSSYYLAFIVLGLVTASMGPTLPGLAESTGSSLKAISVLFIARSGGYLIGSVLSGYIYDRVRSHPVFLLVLVGMGLSMGLIPVIGVLALLFSVMLVLGFFEGSLDVGCNTVIVWLHGAKVGPYMNGLHFFFGIGAFLSPLIVAQVIIVTGTFKAAYWLVALAVLPAIIWLSRMPSPNNQTQMAKAESTSSSKIVLALVVMMFALVVGAEVGFGNWVYTYVTTKGLALVAGAGLLNSAFFGAFTAGRLLAVPIAGKYKAEQILLVDLLGCVLSLLVLLLSQNSLTAVWVGTLGFGFSMASIFPTLITYAERRMRITGKVTSWFFVGASLGSMVSPWLIGQFFVSVGPWMVFVLLIVEILLALVTLWVINVVARRHQTELVNRPGD
jgi:FHS family Na+ dependent glucose MFS transporter 1